MNAMVGVKVNGTGLFTPDPEQQRVVRERLQSMAKANLMGKVLDGKTIQMLEKAGEPTEAQLGRDTFLGLLTTQLRYQDPLEPVENTEMVAQLAQFSSLEQMTQLNESFGLLSGNIDQLNFISGSSLLGRTVSGVTEDGLPVSGEVERIELVGSLVYLTVNGERISMAGVTGIV